MNFVAIDFETANDKMSSVCQVGIVVVREGTVTDRAAWLVKPHDHLFNRFNTYVHGITEDLVKNEPEFCEVWPYLKGYLQNQTIIAHNAGFDINVLRNVLDVYQIEYPKANFLCSVKIAKKVWTSINRHGLKSMANFLDIDFTHHDAVEDAFASAEIVIRAAREVGVKSLKALTKRLEIHPGQIFPGRCLPIRQLNEFNLKKVDPLKLNPRHPFYSKTIVFTGKLKKMVRREAMQRTADVGGVCASSVNEFTRFLVIGNDSYKRYKEERLKSRKIKKAESLIEQGYGIKLITEKEFVDLLKYE